MTQSMLQLRSGTVGRLVMVDGEGPLAQRLLAMGFLPGQRVERREQAPLGGPLKVHGTTAVVALRPADAETLHVEPGED
jgi:Fe2+ transport system protein FeoA